MSGSTTGASLWPFGRRRQAAAARARSQDPRTDGRRHTRYSVHDMHCPLGDVVDLSESGAQVRCKKRPQVQPGQAVQLGLRAGNQLVQVSARVLRVERHGWRTFEVGLQFVGLSPSLASAVVVLARFGFVPKGEHKIAPEPARQPIRADYTLPDHYATLGLASTATDHQIHGAYRQLARKLHPDVNPSQDAQERFLMVKQAYDVLRDPQKRQVYDELRNQAPASPFQPRK